MMKQVILVNVIEDLMLFGTPFAITIDDETINNNTVTLRNRDTMEQITLNVNEVASYINEKIKF